MLELPIKVPQHCIALGCQEHYVSGAANGRNVTCHRDNNTIPSLLHTHARKHNNRSSNRPLQFAVCLRIHLFDVPQCQVHLSVILKVLDAFANYATAIINHKSSALVYANCAERFIEIIGMILGIFRKDALCKNLMRIQEKRTKRLW